MSICSLRCWEPSLFPFPSRLTALKDGEEALMVPNQTLSFHKWKLRPGEGWAVFTVPLPPVNAPPLTLPQPPGAPGLCGLAALTIVQPHHFSSS